MQSIELAELATLIIFSINTLLVATLILFKVVHRRRMHEHDIRRERYVGLLSRHLSFENCTDPITPAMAEDSAFLDALIDVRNAVTGPELKTLHDIVSRHGVLEHQVRRLQSSFSLARRLRAAVALAELGDESAATVLMDHLEDREPEIRIQCGRGLGRIQWTPAIDRIVWRFGIETPWVRARFSDTLTGFGSKATWPLLAYVRINHRFEATGPALALRTIAQIGDHQAVRPLLQILEEANDIEIEIAAVEALGDLGSTEAIPTLQATIVSPRWELRAKSATALGDIGDPSSIPLLLACLTDSNWWVRHNAAAAIAHLPGGIDKLYEALEHDDPLVAGAAVEALTDAGELVSTIAQVTASQAVSDEPLLAHAGSPERVLE